MLVELEVELPEALRGEWEPVRFGYPRDGENYVTCGKVAASHRDHCEATTNPMLIVRKIWQWPAWLKAEWIAMDADGYWFAFNSEPFDHEYEKAWFSEHGENSILDTEFFDFTPPPCTDWRTSKRRNPNHKDAA